MNHKQLMQQVAEMKAQMDNYKGELDNLRNQVTAYENVETPIATRQTSTTSRRRMLRSIGLGVAGFGAIAAAGAISGTQALAANPVNSDNAIDATSGPTGYAVAASSSYAPLYLDPNGVSGPPSANGHKTGEVLVDSNGDLYFNAVGNAGGASTFRKLAGPSTAGTLHLLPKPIRFIDTRSALNDPNGPLTHQQIRTYNLLTATITGGNPLPAGTAGVVGNITAAKGGLSGAQMQSGYLCMSPSASINLTTDPSTINFVGGVTLANSFSCGLTNGSLSVGAFFQTNPGSGAISVIIDITGYYR